jgi:hypothetical protein
MVLRQKKIRCPHCSVIFSTPIWYISFQARQNAEAAELPIHTLQTAIWNSDHISTSHGMTGRNFFDVFLPFYLLFGF